MQIDPFELEGAGPFGVAVEVTVESRHTSIERARSDAAEAAAARELPFQIVNLFTY